MGLGVSEGSCRVSGSGGSSRIWGPRAQLEESDGGISCGFWGVCSSLGDSVGLGDSRGPQQGLGTLGCLEESGGEVPGGP